MAEKKTTAEKKSGAGKKDLHGDAPKTKLLMIGGALIVFGLGLCVYEAVRPETKDEKRMREDQEQRDAYAAKRAAKKKEQGY